MQPSTLEIVKAGLRADPTVTPADRVRILALLRSGAEPSPAVPAVPRLLRHAEAAARLGVTKRSLTNFVKQGVLSPVTLPGRVRALGFREADVSDLIGVRGGGRS